MILLRNKEFSTSSRIWAGTKGALRGGARGAAMGALISPLYAYPVFNKGKNKLATGLVGGSALIGAGLGAAKGWNSAVKDYDKNANAKNYTCPSINDLPGNIKSELLGVERAWKKTQTQELLQELMSSFFGGDDVVPFTPYVDKKDVKSIFEDFVKRALIFSDFPEDTLMYPLMCGCDSYGEESILCYNITTKKFWCLEGNDYIFEEEATKIKSIKDFIKGELEYLNYFFESRDYQFEIIPKEFEKLIKEIKKAFGIN